MALQSGPWFKNFFINDNRKLYQNFISFADRWHIQAKLSQAISNYKYISLTDSMDALTINPKGIESWSAISSTSDHKYEPNNLQLNLIWINNYYKKYEILTKQPSYDTISNKKKDFQ